MNIKGSASPLISCSAVTCDSPQCDGDNLDNSRVHKALMQRHNGDTAAREEQKGTGIQGGSLTAHLAARQGSHLEAPAQARNRYKG
jgi:hypothetical protein